MKIIKIILLILIPLIIISCKSTTSDPNIFYKLTKKMDQKEFQKKYKDYIIDSTIVEIESKEYKVFYAEMTTLKEVTSTSSTSYSFSGTPITTSISSTYSHNNKYIFIFEENKYFYSGFLYEFQRHQNDIIKKIGIALLEKTKEDVK